MEIAKIVTTAMVFVITSYIVGLLGFHWRTQKYDKNIKILKSPKSILWISVVLILFFIAGMLLVIFLTQTAEALLGMFFVPFILIGLYLLLYSVNWRIEIKDSSFIFRNVFGRKKEYRFDHITSVKRIKIGGFKIYINKKCIAVDYWILGIDNLWDILKIMSFKSTKK